MKRVGKRNSPRKKIYFVRRSMAASWHLPFVLWISWTVFRCGVFVLLFVITILFLYACMYISYLSSLWRSTVTDVDERYGKKKKVNSDSREAIVPADPLGRHPRLEQSHTRGMTRSRLSRSWEDTGPTCVIRANMSPLSRRRNCEQRATDLSAGSAPVFRGLQVRRIRRGQATREEGPLLPSSCLRECPTSPSPTGNARAVYRSFLLRVIITNNDNFQLAASQIIHAAAKVAVYGLSEMIRIDLWIDERYPICLHWY